MELRTEGNPGYLLTIKRTFYLRLQNEEVWLSLDGVTWKNWQELLTGMMSLSLVAQSQILDLQVGAEMHLR